MRPFSAGVNYYSKNTLLKGYPPWTHHNSTGTSFSSRATPSWALNSHGSRQDSHPFGQAAWHTSVVEKNYPRLELYVDFFTSPAWIVEYSPGAKDLSRFPAEKCQGLTSPHTTTAPNLSSAK
ncbi:hypothetical protein I7I51_06575 [Histoplasma capsulatum]|uniref:Uncharacterized protein n=1 Tax=Ajellomyces capsulatus TaxID=5037 RepID=A0A8A1MNT7_AJECA|nr:hypothetical protein I7I51_06575 [Histoplasma capsulatum]